jgi:hypothetical protein
VPYYNELPFVGGMKDAVDVLAKVMIYNELCLKTPILPSCKQGSGSMI